MHHGVQHGTIVSLSDASQGSPQANRRGRATCNESKQ